MKTTKTIAYALMLATGACSAATVVTGEPEADGGADDVVSVAPKLPDVADGGTNSTGAGGSGGAGGEGGNLGPDPSGEKCFTACARVIDNECADWPDHPTCFAACQEDILDCTADDMDAWRDCLPLFTDGTCNAGMVCLAQIECQETFVETRP